MSSFVYSQEKAITKDKTQIKVSRVSTTGKTIQSSNTAAKEEVFNAKKIKYKQFSDELFRTQNNIPYTFPKYTEINNVFEDTKNYEISVKQWISNNEKEYDKIKHVINF